MPVRVIRQWALGLAALALLLDQLSKWAVLTAFETPGLHVVVTGFFNLVLTCNYGVSFGQLGNVPAWVFIVLLSLVTVGVIIWLWRQEKLLPALGLGMVIGGAIGNIADRVFIGCVVDFLDFHAFGYHWPAFNIADSAIFLGVCLLIFDGLFPAQDEGKRKT